MSDALSDVPEMTDEEKALSRKSSVQSTNQEGFEDGGTTEDQDAETASVDRKPSGVSTVAEANPEAEKIPEDPPGKLTNVLILSVFTACLGNAFIFGWHIAVVNQPLELIMTWFNKTYYERNGGNFETDDPIDKTKLKSDTALQLTFSFMTGIWVFFAMCGALASAKMADYFGRKKGMWIITLVMNVSGLIGYLCVHAKSPEMLIFCRTIAGIHTGLCTSLNTMYVSEISPTNYRGSLGTMFQLSITSGILFAQILGLPDLLGTKDQWPLLFLLTAVPASLCMVMMPLCPESPRWLLIKQGDEEKARLALVRLRGTEQVDSEMDSFRTEAAAIESVRNYSVIELLKDKSLRFNCVIACVIMLAQQWSGINAVFTYSTLMFQLVAIPKTTVPYMVVLTGTVNVLNTVVAVPLMEKVGRRRLLLYPTMLAMLSFIIMTTALVVQESSSEETKKTLGGLCIAMFMTYIIGFGLGLGPVPFVMVCEIFRQEPRAAAMAIAMVTNWLANLILTVSFPTVNAALGPYVNLPFIVFLGLSIFFIWKYIPETSGKSFEEIEQIMKGAKKNSTSSGKGGNPAEPNPPATE